MKNITISLEDDVAQWARVWAAKQNASVSKMLGKVLKAKMVQEEGYDLAMNKYLSSTSSPLKARTDDLP